MNEDQNQNGSSFEDQFRASVKEAVGETNFTREQPSSSIIPPPDALPGIAGPEQIANLPQTKKHNTKLWLVGGLAPVVILFGVGIAVLVGNFFQARNIEATTEIAKLEKEETPLREKEATLLREEGLTDAYYDALVDSSKVAEKIYEQEMLVQASNDEFASPWEYLSRNGAIYFLGAAILLTVLEFIGIAIIKNRNKKSTYVVAAIGLACLGLGIGIERVVGAGSGNTLALPSMSLTDFANNTDYIDQILAAGNNFSLQNGGQAAIHEGAVGLGDLKDQSGHLKTSEPNCGLLGLVGSLVDFTNDDKSFNNINRASKATGSEADTRTRAEQAAMLHNTLLLQFTETCTARNNDTIQLPKGEYYFVSGHTEVEQHVIKPKNNVNMVGYGIGYYRNATAAKLKNKTADEIGQALDLASSSTNGNNATILKPYTPAYYTDDAMPDMFFFNDYKVLGFENTNADAIYLKNKQYKNLIVDGENAVGNNFTTAGKGFMYNVFENISWDAVVVKNTDGTGFGIDCPKGNSYATNSISVNNGKTASPSSGGASGFGIGTGYADDESFVIKNSIAYGNTKFGFFYEHQNRWYLPENLPYPYNAVVGSTANDIQLSDNSFSQRAFVVENSIGASNLYNYGGERAYDALVSNSTSVAGTVSLNQGTHYAHTITTTHDVYYSGDTRRTSINNLTINNVATMSDVQDPSSWYYEAVKWAVERGITVGVGRNYNEFKFGVDEKTYRTDAITFIWRMMGQPGAVVTAANNNQSRTESKLQNISTCFTDVVPSETYAGAIKWGYEYKYNANSPLLAKGRIILGKVACTGDSGGVFGVNDTVTRAELVTMLWRLAGEPQVTSGTSFTDINEDDYFYNSVRWAVANGITNGVSADKFAPHSDCTRAQAVTFLYRYYKKYGIK